MTASSAGTSAAAAMAGPRPLSVPDVDKLPLLHEPRIDSYRFSMANLEGKQTHKGQMLHTTLVLSSLLLLLTPHAYTRYYTLYYAIYMTLGKQRIGFSVIILLLYEFFLSFVLFFFKSPFVPQGIRHHSHKEELINMPLAVDVLYIPILARHLPILF